MGSQGLLLRGVKDERIYCNGVWTWAVWSPTFRLHYCRECGKIVRVVTTV